MPHISRGKIEQRKLQKIRSGFFEAIAGATGTKQSESLLRELLTPTETTMLMKRLAALSMLCRGYSGYKVHTALRMSPSSAARLKEQLDEGLYPSLEIRLRGYRKRKSTGSDHFLDSLYRLLLMGMPPRCGKGRWKFLFEQK